MVEGVGGTTPPQPPRMKGPASEGPAQSEQGSSLAQLEAERDAFATLTQEMLDLSKLKPGASDREIQMLAKSISSLISKLKSMPLGPKVSQYLSQILGVPDGSGTTLGQAASDGNVGAWVKSFDNAPAGVRQSGWQQAETALNSAVIELSNEIASQQMQ